jgi:hypothetical protein
VAIGDDGDVVGYAGALELVDLRGDSDADRIVAENVFHRAFAVGVVRAAELPVEARLLVNDGVRAEKRSADFEVPPSAERTSNRGRRSASSQRVDQLPLPHARAAGDVALLRELVQLLPVAVLERVSCFPAAPRALSGFLLEPAPGPRRQMGDRPLPDFAARCAFCTFCFAARTCFPDAIVVHLRVCPF